MKAIDLQQKSGFKQTNQGINRLVVTQFVTQIGSQGAFYMSYLVKRGTRYYYSRRVPTQFKQYDSRKAVRIALNTDSRKIAEKLAYRHNENMESYWQTLLAGGDSHEETRYRALADRARFLGFVYHDLHSLLRLDTKELVNRAHAVKQADLASSYVDALIGAQPIPAITLQDALEKYWSLTKAHTLNKSNTQIKKWQNPRKKAIANFIACVGNKNLSQLKRDDILRFRDWWINRLKEDQLVSASANKDFICIKTIISTVAENFGIDIDIQKLFKKLLIANNDSSRRLPFSTDYLRNTLLNPSNLKGMNDQARNALYAFSETGAGFAELTGLTEEDIVLDSPIPHISIRPQKNRQLKTKYRERKIPLVGYALQAFKACPKGFSNYSENPDSLSAVISKYLIENGLMPSKNHSVYSLRHSFQDRLLAVNAPDRVQADLMGHKFSRQAYGNGASLEQKYEWLKKIELKSEMARDQI